MLKNLYSLIVLVLLSLLMINNSYAQTILTHNTGTIAVSMYDNAYIGHNFSASTGSGVVFSGGLDAMYTAGFVAGYSLTKTVGLVGSFTSSGVPVMQDWVTTAPFGSFTSNTNFNQIAVAGYNDASAPAANLIGLIVNQTSLSNTNDDYVIVKYTVTNNSGSAITGLYTGIFADWDVGLNNFALNRGGYDQARNLAYQYENGGAMDTRYYGLVAFNGLAGARVTTNSAFGTGSGPVRDSIFTWISTFLNESITTNGDYRSIIGSGPYNLANGASIVVGFGVVAGTDLADLQANSDAAQNKWTNVVVPVELSSFTASVNPLGQVALNWTTATETNNRGFEVQRKSEGGQFATVGFIEGFGTTSETQNYSFLDKSVNPGAYLYRLKQIDYNGQYEYSKEIEVNVAPPLAFGLDQNYPNPFNPNTNIKFSLSESGNVKLTVYNTLGEEVALLINGYKDAGSYEMNFNASNLPSGTYIYKLEAPGFIQAKKMILMK